ncbi:class I SAM-dependent methyltransferase [Candidatus Sumerlaeota bacterium]|nr:class I SAM-dependent methyltransferase [Candidatus Sumerlaeota bacterium]
MNHWTEFSESDLKTAWDIHWHWEWFINNKWPMADILRSPSSLDVEHIAPVLRERGVHNVLDVTCGFGLKTILLQKYGFHVSGSDISSVAVGHACEIAKRERLSLEYKVSPWSSLCKVWEGWKFDCVFCDALSWTPNEEILSSACCNFHSILNENGILLWAGAPKGSPGKNGKELATGYYISNPAFEVDKTRTLEDGANLTRIICRELDGEGVLVHRAYVIARGNSQKIEVSSIVEPACWSWDKIWGILKASGFTDSETIKTSVNGKERLHNISMK